MKQTFTIETTHKVSALELAGMFDDAGIKKYKIGEVEIKDIQEEMIGMLEYIGDNFVCENTEGVYSAVADYFDFKNRCVPVEQHEIDFIKVVFDKKMQKKIFGKVF